MTWIKRIKSQLMYVIFTSFLKDYLHPVVMALMPKWDSQNETDTVKLVHYVQ